MNNILYFLIVIIALIIATIWAFKAGINHAKQESSEDEQDVINKANHYRDRLINDDDYSKRVRDRFER